MKWILNGFSLLYNNDVEAANRKEAIIVRKKLTVLCLCGIAALLLAGCGGSDTEERTIYGRIKSVDGKKITIELAEKNEDGGAPNTPTDAKPGGDFDGPDGQKPDGEPDGSDGQKPDGNPPSDMEKPDGKSDGPDGQKPGGRPQGGGMGMPGLSLTGEEETVTYDDDTEIKVNDIGRTSDGSAEDIAAGAIVTVTMTGDKVTAIIFNF